MAELVRLRHREAERLVVKAKEQAILREKELQALREKREPGPPELELLGRWQVIEETFVRRSLAGMEWTLGDHRLFLTALSPDGHLSGQYVESGGTVECGRLKGRPKGWSSAYEVQGKVTSGQLRFRLAPISPRAVAEYVPLTAEPVDSPFGIRQFA